MTKHITDTPSRLSDGARSGRFAEIEKRSGEPADAAAVQALHRQPAVRKSDARTRAFTRIERDGS